MSFFEMSLAKVLLVHGSMTVGTGNRRDLFVAKSGQDSEAVFVLCRHMDLETGFDAGCVQLHRLVVCSIKEEIQ
jgi:hypothetical protein